MTQATHEASGDGAQAPAPVPPVTSRARTGMVDDPGEMSTAQVREMDEGNPTGADAPVTGDNVGELMALLHGLADQLERLEESQTKLTWERARQGGCARSSSRRRPWTPACSHLRWYAAPVCTLTHSGGRGSPRTTPRRPVLTPQYFGLQRPGYGPPESNLQRIYAEPHAPQPPPGTTPAQPAHQGNQATRFPDSRQKMLAIQPFDDKELYVGLGPGFLEW
ncbi:unnamed protein product [Phytophthora fragariaefolia]|uniref:Unnamed protein product n=1 Tax=Phytophthora fragariaefolia TaxID=1490495 RepID=A0A9W6XUQ0_9STRA|nr:unnamed protein product [Phytophthora fragariaefolia]